MRGGRVPSMTLFIRLRFGKKQMGQLALKIFEQYKNSVETNHFLKCGEIVILTKETNKVYSELYMVIQKATQIHFKLGGFLLVAISFI